MLSAKCQMLNSGPQFDLAIVGAGPAGTSCAITAARLGARVGLFEAKDFPRHRVCGEFVSAESLDVLAGLLQDVTAAEAIFQSAPGDRPYAFAARRKRLSKRRSLLQR